MFSLCLFLSYLLDIYIMFGILFLIWITSFLQSCAVVFSTILRISNVDSKRINDKKK